MTIESRKDNLLNIYKEMAINDEIPVTSLFDGLFVFCYKYLNTNIVTNRILTYEISTFYLSIILSILNAIFYKSTENKTIKEIEKILNYLVDISKYSNVKDIPSYTDEYRLDPSSILSRKDLLFKPINKIKGSTNG